MNARRPKSTAPTPTHPEWEVLHALLQPSQILQLHEHRVGAAYRVVRCSLPARSRPVAAPVPWAVAHGLLSRGWLAKVVCRKGGGSAVESRVSEYRLSLRGWYAARRARPDLVAAKPAGRKPIQPTLPEPPPTD